MTSYHAWTHAPKAQGGTDPIEAAGAVQWAILAIPDGQDVPDDTLTVVVNYERFESFGDSFSLDEAAGEIIIAEGATGIYDIHSWAEFDNETNIIEGPVFQSGQDFQDIGYGLLVHSVVPGVNMDVTIMQHKTTWFVADAPLPQSVNLQVAQFSGGDDLLVNGGLTIVKLADYSTS